jgi:hypothetical protein
MAGRWAGSKASSKESQWGKTRVFGRAAWWADLWEYPMAGKRAENLADQWDQTLEHQKVAWWVE